MNEKVTMQDIANALNLSRNTVSKVFNNKNVHEETKELVLNKAIELGYKNFNILTKKNEQNTHLNILLLAGKPLTDLDFFAPFVKGVESSVTVKDIDYFQYIFNENTSLEQLNNYINSLKIDGIIGIELYNTSLLKNILNLEIPTIFVDAPLELNNYNGNYDIILMEGRFPIKKLTHNAIKNGYNRVAFCGDHTHCMGFYDRFLGMRDALSDFNFRLDLRQSLIFKDGDPYGDLNWITGKINKIQNKPNLYVCANDSIAASVVRSLTHLGYKIPSKVQVIGFDNTIDSITSTPKITTINVDKELLGKEAFNILLERIKRKNSPIRTIYFRTSIVYRETTTK